MNAYKPKSLTCLHIAWFQSSVRLFVSRTPFEQGGETMNAGVTLVQILPGKMDQGIELYRDSVVPAAMQQKGCKGVYLLTDRKTGRGISIDL